MIDNSSETIVGRVLRASTRGFDCGAHSRNIGSHHDFGAFVRAPIANDERVQAIGLIYKVEIKDDQLIAELVLGEAVPDAILRDQRENRMIPVEIKVLNVGYFSGGQVLHSMPPRPPMSLSDVLLCTPQEVYDFTQRHDFFRLILGASEVPGEDLIAAAIRYAAGVYADADEQRAFLVSCGRQLARDLSGDLKRLAHILALIRP
ncbi:MAG: hypothetical protein MUE40_09170 [Anaerolineae bacterium]|jgi:hypothetical protein|nr:hypothetical protein [Anaerolineae bacterium]